MLGRFLNIKKVIKSQQTQDELTNQVASQSDENLTKAKDLFNSGKISESIPLFEESHKSGNPEASYYLGLIYEDSLIQSQDIEKAFTFYKTSASSGFMEAQYKLGMMFVLGKGTEKDYNQAMVWFGKAGDKGHPKALFNLGVINEFGLGVLIDLNRAETLYQKAADLGLVEAMIRLAKIHILKGKNDEAKKLIDQAIERDRQKANLFIPKILSELGNKDLNLQVKHLYEAYKMGDYQAGISLGKLLIDANRYDDALKLFQILHEKGVIEGTHNLANMYYNGLGVEKNPQTAIELYKISAQKGHSHSCLNLGILYYRGLGVENNQKEAFQWIKRGADLGNPRACFLLSVFYLKGIGCSHDEAKADQWFKRGTKLLEKNKDVPIKISYRGGLVY